MKSPRANKKLSAHELARFLFFLARTGNFAFACDRLGRAKSGLYKRRARDPDFAADCKAALAQAHAGLWRTEGGRRPAGADGKSATTLSTYAGRPQLRRAAPGTLAKAGRQHFLETLAATGNIRFAAHSVGIAPSSIHYRRKRDPAFARAMDAAIDTAAAALELRVIEASGVFLDDPPRNGEGDHSPAEEDGGGGPERSGARAIGTLTASEALHFLTLHARNAERRGARCDATARQREEPLSAGRRASERLSREPRHDRRHVGFTPRDEPPVTASPPPRDETPPPVTDSPPPLNEPSLSLPSATPEPIEPQRPSPRIRRL